MFDYFKANGFPESQMVMRFHGERYPLVPNNSPANRAKNRRSTVQLSRVELPVEAPSAPAGPAAPAAAPATPSAAPAAKGEAPKAGS
ncbi:hypothetical protein D3C84_1092050 [compost metagenome]